MSIESLQLLPRGRTGWGTEVLAFGRTMTFLLGANGSGKTPLIKALAYCLGHPVELPPLVREKCHAVKVVFASAEGRFQIERQFTSGVQVTVTDPGGVRSELQDERELSEWVLKRLGVSLRILSGKNGDKIRPYVSVVAPMFIVDQDIGWMASYVPLETHQFVKDQREEVVRWLLDVPARNRPTDKREFAAAKTTLASLQEQIAFKRMALEALQRELGEDQASDGAQRLEERRAALEAELSRAHSFLENMSKTESLIDVRVREAGERRDQLGFRLASVKRRKTQLVDVQGEVGAELGALEKNELAAAAFRTLCGNEACQFFRKPEESYGRRVLYLKDQLKDFESSSGETERELAQMREEFSAAEAAVREVVAAKEKSLAPDGVGAVGAVNGASRELADVQVRLDRLERTARERRQLEVLIDKEARALEEVGELRPKGGGRKDNARLLDAREHLAANFKEWMLVLRTPNVDSDVVFDDELRLIVGGEKFSSKSSHSGSTRTRLVLAYHAALVETSLRMKGVHPRLLVLDAPRQHELSAADLRAFIERFCAMSAAESEPVQLVFSAIDREAVPEGRVDALWEPPYTFRGERGPELRFLGPSSDENKPSAA